MGRIKEMKKALQPDFKETVEILVKNTYGREISITDVTLDVEPDGNGKPFFCIIGWNQPKSLKAMIDYSRSQVEAIKKLEKIQELLIEAQATALMRKNEEKEKAV